MALFLSLVSVSLVPSAVPFGMGCARTGAGRCAGPPLVVVVAGPLLVVAGLCGLILRRPCGFGLCHVTGKSYGGWRSRNLVLDALCSCLTFLVKRACFASAFAVARGCGLLIEGWKETEYWSAAPAAC